ncbi:MAG: nuclear transport factor 2 family protein [Pseudomonadota bacterium]
MSESNEDLAARIQRLEDIEAIRQLKALYCEICDDHHNPDRIVTIFTEDGIWEGKGIATANGHAEIRALFERFGEMMSFTEHMTMNPRIEIDGDSAIGTWYFFGPFTFKGENPTAKWQAARYHEKYQRVEGEWKIAHLKVGGPGMSVFYDQGWADSLYQ